MLKKSYGRVEAEPKQPGAQKFAGAPRRQRCPDLWPSPELPPNILVSPHLSSAPLEPNEVVGIFNRDKHVVLASAQPSVTAARGAGAGDSAK